jgi:hypothetical protein
MEADIGSLKNSNFDQKWWFRFAKLIYIGLYIALPFLLVAVWNENSGYYGYTKGAFRDIFLIFVTYFLSIRLVKIIFFYIAFGSRPQLKKEFKKFF